MIRSPVAARMFYTGDAAELRRQVSAFLATAAKPVSAYGLIAPHAGYVYSGALAGSVYSRVILPQAIILLCPNHTGLGSAFSVWHKGSWKTPLGESLIAEDLAAELLDTVPCLEADTSAHMKEHSAEVHLPFIQILNPSARIVPIVVAESNPDTLVAVGEALGRGMAGRDVLLAVSNDMSHYFAAETAARLDRPALDAIARLDATALHSYVTGHHTRVCGVYPLTLALTAMRAMGAERADLVGYTHSGIVSGDLSEVVGYAGFVIPRETV